MGFVEGMRRWFTKLVPSDRDLPAQQRIGKRGEKEAVAYLKRKGYTILERNFRGKHGEIDIAAFRDGVLAFVEVRARTRPFELDPLYTVGKRKQTRIAKTAHTYVKLHNLELEDILMRFDVITIALGPHAEDARINHVEGAFEA